MSDVATGASPNPSGADAASVGATSGPASGAAPASAWTDGFDPDSLGFVQNKGWAGPKDVLTSYRNLEKLVGAGPDKLLQIPGADDADAWNSVYNRLGRPEKPEDYSINMPKEMADEEFAGWARNTFHELGLTNKQAEALSTKWNEYMGGRQGQSQEAYKMEVAQQNDALKKEWGAAYDQNLTMAKTAAREFGLDGATIDKLEQAMGFAGLMKFMQGIGSKIGEASFVSGDGAGAGNNFGAMTPQGAMQQISALRADPAFVKRYTEGDTEARAKMEQLHKWAYPA